jgi:hypothetical protein
MLSTRLKPNIKRIVKNTKRSKRSVFQHEICMAEINIRTYIFYAELVEII